MPFLNADNTPLFKTDPPEKFDPMQIPTDMVDEMLVRDLQRLRDPKANALLLTKKTDEWEIWAQNATYIEELAMMVFLDDRLVRWIATPGEPTRPVNPNAAIREEAYREVMDAQTNSSGIKPPLWSVRGALVDHFEKRAEAEKEMQRADSAKAENYERSRTMRRHVRKHTAAAAVVGTAVARGVLGDGAPLIADVRYVSENIDRNGKSHGDLRELCAAMETALAPPGNGGPESLRLSELCSIMQHVLP